MLKKLRTPKVWFRNWLRMPILGLAIRIQEMVIRTPGMMIRPTRIIPMSRASGVSVRSTTQAMKAPTRKATRVEQVAKDSVFQLVDQKPDDPKARV